MRMCWGVGIETRKGQLSPSDSSAGCFLFSGPILNRVDEGNGIIYARIVLYSNSAAQFGEFCETFKFFLNPLLAEGV